MRAVHSEAPPARQVGDVLTGASIAPPIPASAGAMARAGGAHLPAPYESGPAVVSAVVDMAVPGALVMFVARAVWLLAHAGTPVSGSVAWLVATLAYAGRAERLGYEASRRHESSGPARRGAGGSALGALASAIMFLLSLAK